MKFVRCDKCKVDIVGLAGGIPTLRSKFICFHPAKYPATVEYDLCQKCAEEVETMILGRKRDET